MLRLFSKLDRRLSMAGEALLGDRCSPALMVAAACREDKGGLRGDGGAGQVASSAPMEILRGLNWDGEDGIDCRLDVGRVFKSGVIVFQMWSDPQQGSLARPKPSGPTLIDERVTKTEHCSISNKEVQEPNPTMRACMLSPASCGRGGCHRTVP